MAPRRRASPVRKPTQMRREEIADVAMRILALEGARRFTTKILATRVGITEGAIFRHFPSMAAIADAIVDRMAEVLGPSFAVVHADPLHRLRLFFFKRTQVLMEKPELARLLLSDHLAQAAGPAHARRVSELRKKTQQLVRNCLQEAKGAFAGGTSLDGAILLVTGAIMALAHVGYSSAASGNSEEIIHNLWRLVEQGLCGKEIPR